MTSKPPKEGSITKIDHEPHKDIVEKLDQLAHDPPNADEAQMNDIKDILSDDSGKRP